MTMTQIVRACPYLLHSSASAYLHQNVHAPSMSYIRAVACGCKFPTLLQPRPRLIQQRRSMSKENVRWLWPALDHIYLYDAGDRHGTRKGFMRCTFNTAQPLEPQHFKQTLIHLQRRCPNLRACLRPRGETLWFCEPSTQLQVNFKVIEDGVDLSEHLTKMIEKPFSYTDPVQWRAVLVPRGDQATCPAPEVRASFPYQYDYIFHLHHALCDGLDAVLIMYCTLDILNDILAGRPVDEKQWVQFTDKEDLRILKEDVRKTLMENPKRIDEVRSSLPPTGSTPLLLETFPKPNVSKASTGQVERIIEPAAVKQMQKKARETGVTFNSSMVAAINTAIVELAKEAGNMRDSYTVKARHNVSLRRHLKHKSKHVAGPYPVLLSHSSTMGQDVNSCFWGYTKNLHQELSSSLKSRLSLEQEAVIKMTQPEVSPDEYFTTSRPVLYDYGMTNLGDLSRSMRNDHDHVKLTEIISSNIMHNSVHTNFHQFLTFHGRCFYTISYDTKYFAHETVTRLADKVLAVIEDVSERAGTETLIHKL